MGGCFPVNEVSLERELKTEGRGRNNLEKQRTMPPWFFVLTAERVMHADTFGSTPTTLISAICSNAV